MKQIIQPHQPNNSHYEITEGINYFDKGDSSIWGEGDELTLQYLSDKSFKGTWLNAGAGDGRYSEILLQTVDKLVASDIDAGALSKLYHRMDATLRSKLDFSVFNLANDFPYPDKYFDGIFCTGLLHLFPKEVLIHVFHEFDRVLKSNGLLVIDFATDIRRTYQDGTLKKDPEGRVDYHLQETKTFISRLLPQYKMQTWDSEVVEDRTPDPHFNYIFTCKYFLLEAKKHD